MRHKLLLLLLGLVLLFVPLWPGRVLTLKVIFMQYACAPCAEAEAFRIVQVYAPTDHYLLDQDIILYDQGRYLRENNHLFFILHDSTTKQYRPVRVLAKLYRRSLFDRLAGTTYKAAAYKVAYH